MNILYIAVVFLSLLSLSFTLYFLISLIVAKTRNQPKADYLKKFVVSAIILALSLTGLFLMPETSEDEKPSAAQNAEEIPQQEESPPKQIQVEVNKQADREAKQREKLLSKTLRVTPTEFDSQFLESMQAAEDDYFAMPQTLGEPKITDNDKTERRFYMFNDSVGMNELIDKSTGNIKEINVILFEISREDIEIALRSYVAAIKIVNPDLSDEDINNIENELGLGSEIMRNLIRNKSTVFNGKKYSHRLIEGSGVVFSINIP